MSEIRQHIDQAYKYLSKILVKEDDVDRMALARQELREAYALAEKREKEQDTEKEEP